MAFSGAGSGIIGDEYIITSISELYEMFTNLTSHFKLGNNIDASDSSSGAGTQPWNGPAGWLPLDGSRFEGSLNGDGFSITGLYTNENFANQHFGLFYERSANITNLTLHYEIEGLDNTAGSPKVKGGLAAYDVGTIVDTNVTVHLTAHGNRVQYLGGGCGSDEDATITRTDCEYNLDLLGTGTDSWLSYCGAYAYRTDDSVPTFTNSVYRLRVRHENETINCITEALGSIYGRPTGQPFANITNCRAFIDVFAPLTGKNIGGFFGYNTSTYSNNVGNWNITKSWVVGRIVAQKSCGGFDGRGQTTDYTDCWSGVDVTVTNPLALGGLFNGITNTTGGTRLDYNRVISFGKLTLLDLNNGFFSLTALVPTTESDTYYNSTINTVQGISGDLTAGSGLTSTELQDVANLPGFSAWENGAGKDGMVGLTDNPYDPDIFLWQIDDLPLIEPSAEWVDATSHKVTVDSFGFDESTLDSKRIEWDTDDSTWGNSQAVAVGDTFEHTIPGLTEGDVIFYRAVVVYNGDEYRSEYFSFVQSTIQQVEYEILEATERRYLGDSGMESRGVHDIRYVDGYLYGSPRNAYPDGTRESTVFKIDGDDFTTYEGAVIVDDQGDIVNNLEGIVSSHNFLWTSGDGYLVRIDPADMSYRLFSGVSGESILIDGDILYLASGNVQMYSITPFLGTFTDLVTANPSPLLYEIDPDVDIHSSLLTSEQCHNLQVDANYIYAGFFSGSGYTVDSVNGYFEVLKLDKTDLSFVALVQAPKCTASPGQDDEYLYYGIEASGTAPAYGGDWGCIAIRKSDMVLFACNKYHTLDTGGVGLGSGACVRKGDKLFDTRNALDYDGQTIGGMVFVLDISDPSSWLPTEPIGSHTLKVFSVAPPKSLGGAAAYPDRFKRGRFFDTDGIGNPFANDHYDLEVDENGQLFIIDWNASSPSAVTSVYRVDTGIEFSSAPTVQTLNITDQGSSQFLLDGFLLDINGSTVTDVGFEWGIDSENLSNSHSESYVSDSFSHQITLTAGTWYYRAFAVNDLGAGYGQILSIVVEQLINENGIVSLPVGGGVIEGARVLLIDQDSEQVVAATSTDSLGQYSFNLLGSASQYMTLCYYFDSENERYYTSVLKPFKSY